MLQVCEHHWFLVTVVTQVSISVEMNMERSCDHIPCGAVDRNCIHDAK